jgi:hypothetical protein
MYTMNPNIFHVPIRLFDFFDIDTLKVARDRHEASQNQKVVINNTALRSYITDTTLATQTCLRKKAKN